MDVATRQNRHILGINAQYIDGYKIIIYTLGMVELRSRHTGENLKQEILNCLDQFKIEIRQIYSSTTDNGANVIKTSKLLQISQGQVQNNPNDDSDSNDVDDDGYDEVHNTLKSTMAVVRCAAHTLQLAAYDVIKTMQTNIESCRKAVKSLRCILRGTSNVPILDNATQLY
ncbi:uncharacterized protein LOC118756918 [Rhagoletis pomonella]|uniref:uncharacterized protein LOC118756918 n=1 Tax=Rhagoletis pomonella TaxID=28610 RepID=UPI00178296D8|nr:uncharacterized protein LOC118756918 [Rhagoletis pomonella]